MIQAFTFFSRRQCPLRGIAGNWQHLAHTPGSLGWQLAAPCSYPRQSWLATGSTLLIPPAVLAGNWQHLAHTPGSLGWQLAAPCSYPRQSWLATGSTLLIPPAVLAGNWQHLAHTPGSLGWQLAAPCSYPRQSWLATGRTLLIPPAVLAGSSPQLRHSFLQFSHLTRGKMSGDARDIMFFRLSPSDYDQSTRLIADHFMRRNPLCRAIGQMDLESYGEQFLVDIKKCLASGVSVGARDRASQTLAGICLNFSLDLDEAHDMSNSDSVSDKKAHDCRQLVGDEHECIRLKWSSTFLHKWVTFNGQMCDEGHTIFVEV
ncbi:uncharacterized protein [Cherax quadricarinatus]